MPPTRRRESGSFHTATLAALVSLIALVALIAFLGFGSGRRTTAGDSKRLLLYCAAGLKPPVTALAEAFEERYGVEVDIQFGGSGTLLSNVEIAQRGDLYLAADDSYIETARQRALVRESIPLAKMKPVIGVARGNPLGIHGLDDLRRDDVALGLANPDAAAVGRITRQVLQEQGQWQPLIKHAKVTQPTVTELANDLRLGALDAAILWDATAAQYEDIDSVSLPLFDPAVRNITVGVLSASERPTLALRFARFMGSRDIGKEVFEREGYRGLDGDIWAEEPEIVVMSGAMLNPAVEQRIRDFEEREGCRVTRIYNGCGVLVSQMRAGTLPDAYFSCDVSFMDKVQDLFGDPFVLSGNRIVMLVAEGNPKELQETGDLSRDGLRVGLAHPQKSALGALTVELLKAQGHHQALLETGNVVVESPTGDYLVNQIRLGALDAVLVYRSNAAFALDDVDVVPIPHELARATQPLAIGLQSDHSLLVERLMSSLREESSRESFEALGFEWLLEDDAS